VTAIEWIAAVLLVTGLAGAYFVVRRYMRRLLAPWPTPREELPALGDERKRRIARAMTEGSVVDDPDDAGVALEAYERSRRWLGFWRLLVFGVLGEVGILLFAIHFSSLLLYVIVGFLGCGQAVIAARAWRLRRLGDRWAAATRAHHAR